MGRDWIELASGVLEEGVKAIVPGAAPALKVANMVLAPQKADLTQWRHDRAKQKAFAESVKRWGAGRKFGDADMEDGMRAAASILKKNGADLDLMAQLNLDPDRIAKHVLSADPYPQQRLEQDAQEVCAYSVATFYLRYIRERGESGLNQAVFRELLARSEPVKKSRYSSMQEAGESPAPVVSSEPPVAAEQAVYGGNGSPDSADSAAQTGAVRQLANEKLIISFADCEPIDTGVLEILQDYRHDLNAGHLKHYHFTTAQLAVRTEPQFDLLLARYTAHGSRMNRRLMDRLDEWTIEGTRVLLDALYIGERQVEYAWSSIYWFVRALHHWRVALLRQDTPTDLLPGDYGRNCRVSPLLGRYDWIEEFYGSDLIKLDLWNPADNRERTSCFFPVNGYAGSWFDGVKISEEYFASHYSPNDYFNYLMPQLLMRHFVNREPFLTGETMADFWIGPA
jgi:hypothetical protein